MGLEIRLCRDGDYADMAKVWNEVVEAGNAFPQTEPLTHDTVVDFFGSQSASVVADLDGKIMGLYILHPNNVGRCAHIANASYAVASSARGLGLGRKLVEHSLALAARCGFRGLQFNAVVASNAGAMHLYEDMGFTRVGKIPGGFINGAGAYEDIFIYYKNCEPAIEN